MMISSAELRSKPNTAWAMAFLCCDARPMEDCLGNEAGECRSRIRGLLRTKNELDDKALTIPQVEECDFELIWNWHFCCWLEIRSGQSV